MEVDQESSAEYLAWARENLLDSLSRGESQQENVSLLLDRTFARLSAEGVKVMQIAGVLALAPIGRWVMEGVMEDGWRRGLKEGVSYGLFLKEGDQYTVGMP